MIEGGHEVIRIAEESRVLGSRYNTSWCFPKSQTLSTTMSAQQPIVIPDSPVVETVELPVADPAPVLPDYEEVSVPTMEEMVLNWLTLEDAHVNQARVGDYIRTTSRIFQQLLYIC